VTFALPYVENPEVAFIPTGKLQSIDNVLNVDEIANGGPVSPNLDWFTLETARDERCDNSLVLGGSLKGPEGIGDPKHTIVETMKVLVKREVLLDHQLADAIGGDRLGWRRLRSRHDLR